MTPLARGHTVTQPTHGRAPERRRRAIVSPMRAVTLLAASVTAAACGPADLEGTCKDMLIAGDLVITEVFADYQAPNGGTGADEGREWFEIYNGSGRAIELRGLTVVHGRPDGSRQRSHLVDDVTIAPDQFFTMGNSAQDLLPPYIDYGYGKDLGDLLNTKEGGKLELRCGTSLIDAATYEDVRPGRSRQLSAAQAPDYTLNDMREHWCESTDTEFEPANFGTPGQDNDCASVIPGQCSDGGVLRPTDSPGPGDLVITEVMPSPSAVADASGEWFEARVMRDLDLNGIGIDRAGDKATPDLIEATECVRVFAGMHVVFARSADPLANGGLAVAGTFRFALIAGSVESPGDVRIMNDETIVDAVRWTSSRNARSLSLDPDFTTDTANDDSGNFCDGDSVYYMAGTAMDFGTPGVPNPQCPLQPPPGQCLDNDAPRAIVKPASGQLVITELLANPAGTGTDPTQEWFELKNTGATAFDLNGLSLTGGSTTSGSTTVNVIASADCKRVPPGGYALLARSADPGTNGMLPEVDATFSFSLVQSNGSLRVLDGATELDAITWTTGIQDGVSKQLQPALTTTTANNSPDNFCNAQPTQVYGNTPNLGTPKAANACP